MRDETTIDPAPAITATAPSPSPDAAPARDVRWMVVVAVPLLVGPVGGLWWLVATEGDITDFDARLAGRIHDHPVAEGGSFRAAEIVSLLGSPVGVGGLVTVVVIALAWRRRYRSALFLALAVGIGFAVNSTIKVIVGRARPDFDDAISAHGNSFPSGHSMGSAACYGALLTLAWPHLRTAWRRTVAAVATVVLVGAIAGSRLVLDVHFLSDITAGMALGTASMLLFAAVVAPWRDDEPPPTAKHVPKRKTPEA